MSKRSKAKRDARQHKARTRARPCESHVNPIGGLAVISNIYVQAEENTTLDPAQISDIGCAHWLAFDNMTKGASPTADDWGMVAGSMNTALMLAEDGYGYEHQDIFVRAQEGITRAWIRGSKTGRWRFDGEAITDVTTALELHDQQVALVTKADIKAALQKVTERMENGHVFQIEPIAA